MMAYTAKDPRPPCHFLYLTETTFESIQITLYSEKQRMSAVVVAVSGSGDKTRQDVEQGSILHARADKLLGLHGPNN